MSHGRRDHRGGGRRRHGRRGLGRPRIIPEISSNWDDIEGETSLILTEHEIEVIKLVDIDDLTQEEAANKLNVSRATIWRYLKAARLKIATSLVKGSTIHVNIEK